MQWTDEGIVIGVKRHGEASAILELMTREHGRHLGLVRGGYGSRLKPVLQPGNTVNAAWRLTPITMPSSVHCIFYDSHSGARALSAFTRVFDALWRANPESILPESEKITSTGVMDSGSGREPAIGPAFGRTRWGRRGMTTNYSFGNSSPMAR